MLDLEDLEAMRDVLVALDRLRWDANAHAEAYEIAYGARLLDKVNRAIEELGP